jgi:hypothetical protein
LRALVSIPNKAFNVSWKASPFHQTGSDPKLLRVAMWKYVRQLLVQDAVAVLRSHADTERSP